MYKSKKRILIIILIVLIVILAIGATFAILYINTDLFKSDKELFYKYMGQNQSITKLINFSELEQYIEKSESLPHTYDSTVKISASSADNTHLNNSEETNNLNIEINGKKDPINKNESLNFNLKYGQSDLFKLSGIKNNNLYGILSDEIITKYIAVENKNLKDFASKLGFDNTDNIPDKIESVNISEILSLTDEQKNNVFNVLKPVLVDNVPDTSFAKQKEVPLLINNNNITTTTYTLTLNENQFNNIIKNLLTTFKDSEVIVNILKEKARTLGFENEKIDDIVSSYKDRLQEEINSINIDNKLNSEAIKIILYTVDSNLLKTDIIMNEKTTIGVVCNQSDTQVELNISIDNQNSSDQVICQVTKLIESEKIEFSFTINIVVDDEQNKIVFKAEKNGSPNSAQIKDAASFGINNGVYTYRIDYTNTENYTDSINIEKLDSSNSVTLNNYPSEDLQNLMEAILGRTQQVFQEKAIMLENMGVSTDVLFPTYNLFSRSDNILDDPSDTMNAQVIQAFNSQFMPYSGSDSKGSSVKELISSIIANNTTYATDISKQIALSFGQNLDIINTEEMKKISDQIDLSSNYRVILNYSSKGFVNKITIEEN